MPDDTRAIVEDIDILITGKECRTMIHHARIDLRRLDIIVGHLDKDGAPEAGAVYRRQRDDLSAALKRLDGVNVQGDAVALPKAAVEGLIAFGRRYLAHLKDADDFMPAGAQAPEFERALAAFTLGNPIPSVGTSAAPVIEISHA